MLEMRLFTICLSLLLTTTDAVSPAAIYDGGYHSSTSKIELRIGNGGAGQSGLVEALANAFIQTTVKQGHIPFKIAWYKSDTTESINYLKSNTTDLAITYNPAAEGIAIQQGIAKDPSHYLFRDHFYLVGPPSNPANLSKHDDIRSMFAAIFEAGEGNEDPPVRFLSRYDKSVTNIKESQLWTEIGQVPWATAYSTWYHQYIAYPIQALQAAILLDEYTITDRGTHLSLPPEWQNQTVIYKAGTDDPSGPLLNPAHILIGMDADNAEMAERFTQWAVGSVGQNVIAGFKKNGEQLYTAAPTDTAYISRAQRVLASCTSGYDST